ncbi:MAG: tetratricopeptide repeat family protein, partial [Devosia sp.]|uniref:O-linked N-acetylglucosamine transferase, SPINDLY family protein n=1 Tax=Devosia sp. TaxID=1871048 RepID=UPI002619CD1D
MNDERYAEAVRHHQQGRLAEARRGYLEVLAANPGHADALHLLGVADFQQGEAEAGVRRIAEAIRLRPDDGRFHGNLGLALAAAGRSPEALEAYDRALELAPDFAEAMANRSVTLAELGRREEAVAGFERAAGLSEGRAPLQASILARLGAALTKLGDSAGAYEALSRSLEINPGNLQAAGARLFVLNYLSDVPPVQMVEEARAFGGLAASQAKMRSSHRNTPEPDRPLRVGIVSGDLKSSSISRFLDPLLEIDPEQYRVHAYYTRSRVDEVTRKLQAGLPVFRQIDSINDSAAAALIEEDGIDVLCDLSGHSSGNRMGLFARKPAPVQFTWLGYFATTGLAAMDYVLCNDVVVPPAEEWQWVEKPWRMPSTYLCFSPPGDEIDPAPGPAVRDGVVTFGSFNNFSKL